MYRKNYEQELCKEIEEFLLTPEGKKVLRAASGVVSAVEPITKVVVHYSETQELEKSHLRETSDPPVKAQSAEAFFDSLFGPDWD